MKAKGFQSEQDATWNHVKTLKCFCSYNLKCLRLHMYTYVWPNLKKKWFNIKFLPLIIPIFTTEDIINSACERFRFIFAVQHFCFADGAGLCCKYSRLGRGWFLFLVEFAPLLIIKLFLVEQLLEKGFLYLGCAAEVAFICTYFKWFKI